MRVRHDDPHHHSRTFAADIPQRTPSPFHCNDRTTPPHPHPICLARRWRIGDFAWVFVQLAPQDEPKWPQYYMLSARLGQAGALPAPGDGTTDTTGMAVAYDIGACVLSLG